MNRWPRNASSYPARKGNLGYGLREHQQWLVTLESSPRVGWPGDSRSRRWPGLLCAQNPGIFTTLGNTIFPFHRTLPADGWPQCPLCVFACRERQTLSTITLSVSISLSLYLCIYLAVVLLYIKLDPKESLLQVVLKTSLIAFCTKLEWHFNSCISIQTEVVFEFCFKKCLQRISMRCLACIFIFNLASAKLRPWLVQALSCWLLTVEVRVRSQTNSYGICGGQMGAGTRLVRLIRFSSGIINPSTFQKHSFITDAI